MATPNDWEVRFSKSKSLPYFYSPSTGTSVWEAPAHLSHNQIAGLPGAANYLRGATSRPTAQPSGSSESSGPEKVRASHLLIKHRGSRRASSWKEANITRSKEEAIAILREYRDILAKDPSQFPSLAAAESHCSSHAKSGDLGYFSRGQMQKPFEDAVYRLNVGEISGIVDTESGVHLILRTA
ncbi:Peptidyl-prolyl cis-trans isomerase [Phaffia rhodozyma]|uniref:Peptidyl-prolyl cis-trans isomerase n=1 Tax=Phaffia rhodozyma TaxID=264483 RepID=A0A0F7SGR6_PHARH|nr:Peptidyl-prolyl cis-trans isomerase [Phaffia rhodozyma]